MPTRAGVKPRTRKRTEAGLPHPLVLAHLFHRVAQLPTDAQGEYVFGVTETGTLHVEWRQSKNQRLGLTFATSAEQSGWYMVSAQGKLVFEDGNFSTFDLDRVLDRLLNVRDSQANPES